MPIRMFESYGNRDILEKKSLGTLENTILAIDGFWYVRKYLQMKSEQQFANSRSVVEQLVENLAKINGKISILWVWDGIEFNQPALPNTLDMHCKAISDSIIGNGVFKKNYVDQEYFVDMMTELLRNSGIVVVRAPYAAAAQCVSFLGEGAVQNVFSKNDALLFKGCNRLIVEINIDDYTMDVIDRGVLLKTCGIDLDGFRRFALLSGCEYCSTHPQLAAKFNPVLLIDMMKQNTVSNNVLPGYGIDPGDSYYTRYMVGVCIIESHPVLGLNGKIKFIERLSERHREVFGDRHTDQVYYSIFKCNLGVKAISSLIAGKEKPYADKTLLKIFRSEFKAPKSTEIGKNTLMSEFLASQLHFTIDWHSEINRTAQLIFLICLRDGLHPKSLLKILNCGVKDSTGQVVYLESQRSDYLVYLVSKYDPDSLKGFFLMAEHSQLIKETIQLLKINNPQVQNDMDFEFTLEKYNEETKNCVLMPFLEKNIHDRNKFAMILNVMT